MNERDDVKVANHAVFAGVENVNAFLLSRRVPVLKLRFRFFGAESATAAEYFPKHVLSVIFKAELKLCVATC